MLALIYSVHFVHRAAKYGIYTLLDAHQDVLSEKFCGEGIPDWAVDTGCKPACMDITTLLLGRAN